MSLLELDRVVRFDVSLDTMIITKTGLSCLLDISHHIWCSDQRHSVVRHSPPVVPYFSSQTPLFLPRGITHRSVQCNGRGDQDSKEN